MLPANWVNASYCAIKNFINASAINTCMPSKSVSQKGALLALGAGKGLGS
jgi:hypothetical protein